MNQQATYSHAELQYFMSIDKPGSKLPSGNMSMIDRIVQINASGGRYGKGEVLAEFDVSPDKWFFACHFPGDPVMPGCLGLDALWQIAGFFLSWSGPSGKGRALGCDKVKFFGEILPSTLKVTYHIHVKRILIKDIAMIIADGDVYADGQHIYSAEGLKVAFYQLQGAAA